MQLVVPLTRYANADFVAAADVDECAGKNMCEAEEDGGKCVNSPGAYYCECLPGYIGENGELPGER